MIEIRKKEKIMIRRIRKYYKKTGIRIRIKTVVKYIVDPGDSESLKS